ncbi:hypothetical protein ZMO01_16910 [Zymomonas mobilis subsp. mobilis]|nr:hypothetical protein ZMO01_16910 [Zymomonas mobilis subsp. mobilis]
MKKKIYIFRTYRINPKTGKKIFAADYGKRAWRIPVSKEGSPF